MEGTQPILSICIPTYNRADVLSLCLHSIFDNPSYCDNIEVVVANNASIDNTRDVCQAFLSKYQNTFVYIENQNNIGAERNFIKVLSSASGCFLKLHNDYSVFTDNGLSDIYNAVIENIKDKPAMFFGNWGGSVVGRMVFTNLNDLVSHLRFTFSWIGCHGFWYDDFVELEDKDCKIDTQFMQVDWCLRIFLKKAKLVLTESSQTTRAHFIEPQGGYDFFKVQIIQFLGLFKEYVDKKELSFKTYDFLQKELCRYMFGWLDKLRYNIGSKSDFCFEIRNPLIVFFRQFWNRPWFYPMIVRYYMHVAWNKLF